MANSWIWFCWNQSVTHSYPLKIDSTIKPPVRNSRKSLIGYQPGTDIVI